LDLLESSLARTTDDRAFARWDNLNVAPEEYRTYATDASRHASVADRRWADFAAAFACEATTTSDAKHPRVQDTALRTMSGAGHQDFLGSMRNIVQDVRREHIRKALFDPWVYDDPMIEQHTLRWDPADDVRHALRWRDPSGDPFRRAKGAVWGANRLAIEALPLLPTAPVGARLETTGFTGSGRRDTFWSWPIWDRLIDLNVCRSLLALEGLVDERPDVRGLRARGVAAVYRAQRITEGKYRNLTPARVVA
jgi:hypothetical protein